MTVSEDQLTHEEVWDDSALIDSWNEALDEYKARQNRALVPSTNRSDPHLVTPGTAPPTALVSESRDTPGDATAVAPPQVLLGTVQDEGLKKLLMSWYYAGYYTGLYEGQQQQRTQPSAP
ncbi:Serine/threonine-protein kinase spk-1 [Verticillium dahliae VDG1]|nr:Serine/threonine-protein kinase spk-1 [Verticillium dahliae VDG1]